MSCFLFQNSILGNDPLGKNKTILNPCEKHECHYLQESVLCLGGTVETEQLGLRTGSTRITGGAGITWMVVQSCW